MSKIPGLIPEYVEDGTVSMSVANVEQVEVLPRRWVIERTNSWLMQTRRLARDYERLPEHSEAMVKWTMIGLMTRRLAPGPSRRPWQPKTTP